MYSFAVPFKKSADSLQYTDTQTSANTAANSWTLAILFMISAAIKRID